MKMAPTVLQPPSMLERNTITPPGMPISKLSPLGLGSGNLLPSMAPTFNPPQVVPPRVVSPRTPSASPPTMMSNTLFNKPKLYKSPQVSSLIGCSDWDFGTPHHSRTELNSNDRFSIYLKQCQLLLYYKFLTQESTSDVEMLPSEESTVEGSVSDAIGKVGHLYVYITS